MCVVPIMGALRISGRHQGPPNNRTYCRWTLCSGLKYMDQDGSIVDVLDVRQKEKMTARGAQQAAVEISFSFTSG
jgi:hypothetical protein